MRANLGKSDMLEEIIIASWATIRAPSAAISRFSEYIDLSFDRADLGYTRDRDPEMDGINRKQAAKLIGELVGDAHDGYGRFSSFEATVTNAWT
jgi:hypothetical protein